MAPFLRRTGLELNFCCSLFFSAPNRSFHSIDFPPGGFRLWPLANSIKSYLHLLESVKLLDSQSCCFCQAFIESFNIAFAFWADDMPQWIDLPKDWGCETFLPFADKMLLTHHMCLMNIQHGRMSRFFFQVLILAWNQQTTSYLTLNGSDHSLGCSWNKLTAWQLVVWFFCARHGSR